MTKKFMTITLLLAGLALAGCGGAKTEKLIESGNEAFAQQDYATALAEYQQAVVENPELAEPIYNVANVQYRQGEFEQTNATLQVALANADEDLAAEGYFNLGNTHFQSEQFSEAVEAYTESLRLNPNDMDAKVNLELALQKLQQEQQEQQQQEEQQEQQEQEQENQDQQDQQSQDQQSQDEQSQDQQNQDQQQEEQENQDQQDQQNQDEQSQGEQEEEQNEQQENQESQDQQGQGEQEQDQQDQDEQSQGEQEEEQEGQDESESDPQNGEEEAEQPEEQEPQPGQAGGEPTDEQQDPAEMSLGELLEMEGLSEEQARQLLVAASQGTETLQEYLQQMYVFPHSDVEQDW